MLGIARGPPRTLQINPARDVALAADARASPFIGAGAACASTAIVLGLSAVSARDDFDASGRSDAEARDRAVTLRTWTNVAWGAAAATAATGAVLLLSARGGPARASSDLALGPASLRYRL